MNSSTVAQLDFRHVASHILDARPCLVVAESPSHRVTLEGVRSHTDIVFIDIRVVLSLSEKAKFVALIKLDPAKELAQNGVAVLTGRQELGAVAVHGGKEGLGGVEGGTHPEQVS